MAFTESNELQEEILKTRAPMLRKYYNDKPDKELAALNALEELMDELQHPSSKFDI